MKDIEAVAWYWPKNFLSGPVPAGAALSVRRFVDSDGDRGTVAIEMDHGKSGRITLSRRASFVMALQLLWTAIVWKRERKEVR